MDLSSFVSPMDWPTLIRTDKARFEQYLHAWNRQDQGLLDLSGMDLSGLDFTGILKLYNINFRGANLRGANLSNCSLDSVDLTDADLTGCTMHNTFFESSICLRTNFTRTDITEGTFFDTNLHEANFTDAILNDSRFWEDTLLQGAIMKNANMKGAKYVDEAMWMIARGASAITDDRPLIENDPVETPSPRPTVSPKQVLDLIMEAYGCKNYKTRILENDDIRPREYFLEAGDITGRPWVDRAKPFNATEIKEFAHRMFATLDLEDETTRQINELLGGSVEIVDGKIRLPFYTMDALREAFEDPAKRKIALNMENGRGR